MPDTDDAAAQPHSAPDYMAALLDYAQCDEDGVMCVVSRQAVHEAAGEIEHLTTELRTVLAREAEAIRRHDERMKERDAEIAAAQKLVTLWREAVDSCSVELHEAEATVARLKTALSTMNESICQTLGRALGYPKFVDDKVNFPTATEADGVCVGDHVAESLADEAAARIARVTEDRDSWKAVAESYEEERLAAKATVARLTEALAEARDWAARIADDERVCGWVHGQDYGLYCLLADCPVDFDKALAPKGVPDAG